MKIYIQTNKATTNIFGLHTQPRKTTRYTNILELVRGGGEKEKEPGVVHVCRGGGGGKRWDGGCEGAKGQTLVGGGGEKLSNLFAI